MGVCAKYSKTSLLLLKNVFRFFDGFYFRHGEVDGEGGFHDRVGADRFVREIAPGARLRGCDSSTDVLHNVKNLHTAFIPLFLSTNNFVALNIFHVLACIRTGDKCYYTELLLSSQ
jgi:hypothetical protein